MDNLYEAKMPEATCGFILRNYTTPFNYKHNVGVWFPTIGPSVAYNYLPYLKGNICISGKPIGNSLPLIVISGGYAGTLYDQSYLAEAFAKSGFVAISVAHTQFDNNKALGCERAWYRSHEIKNAIDSFLKDPLSEKICNPQQIGLLGFSAGGFSVLPLVGAKPKFDLDSSFKPYLSELNGLNFETLSEPKIKAIGLLAPALGKVFDKKGLMDVKTPTLLITSERDEVLLSTPDIYRSALPNIVIDKILSNSGHFVFNAEVSALMQKLSPESCLDTCLPRKTVHPEITNLTVSFFKKYLAESKAVEKNV